MAKYGLVLDGNIVREQYFDETPDSLSTNKGVWLLFAGTQPTADYDYQTMTGPVYNITDTEIQQVWTVAEKELEEYRAYKLNILENIRYQYEIAGTTWTTGTPTSTYPIDTTRDVQAKIQGLTTAAMLAIQAGQPLTGGYKTADAQFINIDAMQILDLFRVVLIYIETTYGIEGYFNAAIKACTSVDQIRAIDITTNWPTLTSTPPCNTIPDLSDIILGHFNA